MNKLACAAISVVAPTLAHSICNFLVRRVIGVNYKDGISPSQKAFNCVKCCNELAISKYMFSSFSKAFDSSLQLNRRRKGFSNGLTHAVGLAHFLPSSACTYLALTSNPLYAIPAAVIILPLSSATYCKGLGAKVRKFGDWMFDYVNNHSRSL